MLGRRSVILSLVFQLVVVLVPLTFLNLIVYVGAKYVVFFFNSLFNHAMTFIFYMSGVPVDAASFLYF